MTPLDVLRGARELLAKPEAWTQYAWARDASGVPTDFDSESACCWCLGGGVRKVSPDGGAVRISAFRVLMELCPYGYTNLNDNPETTHADVLALLDRAIAGLSAE